MKNFRKTMVCGALLLFGAAACADLDVVNTNDPDRERALATAGDVESLIAGSWQRWYLAEHSVAGPNMFLSAASFQHSSSAANFGMLTYSALPRSPIINEVTHADYASVSYAWTTNYRALAAVAEGLRSINENPQIGTDLGAAATLRARIFGKLVQGLSHASVALLYDRGFVIDETVETIDESGAPVLLGEPIGYQALMTAALAYFDQAVALSNQAGAAGITIPHDWMPLLGAGDEYTMPELREFIYSMKARYRANVARTPAERAAVNWAAVLSDIGNGTHSDVLMDEAFAYTNWLGGNHWLFYVTSATWHKFVSVNGEHITSLSESQGKIVYLPQNNFLPTHLKVSRIMDLFCKSEIDTLRNNPHIKPFLNRKSKELSAGERRMIEILLIVNAGAQYILIDEPFNGVEPIYKVEIKDLIQKHSQEKGFIITDHDYKSILALATRIILLNEGSIKEIKTEDELVKWGYIPDFP